MPNELRPSVPHPSDRSCQTSVALIYDANGHRRWCIDCHAELGVPPEVEGSDYRAAAWVGILLLALVVVAIALAIHGRNDSGMGVPRGESGGLMSSCEAREPKRIPFPDYTVPVVR